VFLFADKPVKHYIMEVQALNSSALVNDLVSGMSASLLLVELGNPRMRGLSAGFIFRAISGGHLIIRDVFSLQNAGEVTLPFQFNNGCLIIKEGGMLVINRGYRARGICNDTTLTRIGELVETEAVGGHQHSSR